jgi:hypothetical protein
MSQFWYGSLIRNQFTLNFYQTEITYISTLKRKFQRPESLLRQRGLKRFDCNNRSGLKSVRRVRGPAETGRKVGPIGPSPIHPSIHPRTPRKLHRLRPFCKLQKEGVSFAAELIYSCVGGRERVVSNRNGHVSTRSSVGSDRCV